MSAVNIDFELGRLSELHSQAFELLKQEKKAAYFLLALKDSKLDRIKLNALNQTLSEILGLENTLSSLIDETYRVE